MINAGIQILAFDGNQTYNNATLAWDGVSVDVNYPTGQNSTNNPITVGDVIIEPDGDLWEVQSVVVDGTNPEKFTLTIQGIEDNSSSTSPNFGNVNRGAVITPVNGVLAPHWNAVLVGTETGRIANLYNAKNAKYGSKDANDLVEGTLSTTVLPTIPQDKIDGLETILTTKASASDLNTVNAAVNGLQTELTTKASASDLNTVNAAVSDLQTLLSSNDTTLDELQEIVNFIKTNKSTLDSLSITSIAGLETALNSKLESADLKTVNGQSINGTGDITIESSGGDTNRMDIEVTSFAAGTYNTPTGVSISKVYSDSSLQIVHGLGKTPASWLAVNKEANPNTAILPSATVNMQVVDANTVIITNLNSFEVLDIILTF